MSVALPWESREDPKDPGKTVWLRLIEGVDVNAIPEGTAVNDVVKTAVAGTFMRTQMATPWAGKGHWFWTLPGTDMWGFAEDLVGAMTAVDHRLRERGWTLQGRDMVYSAAREQVSAWDALLGAEPEPEPDRDTQGGADGT